MGRNTVRHATTINSSIAPLITINHQHIVALAWGGNQGFDSDWCVRSANQRPRNGVVEAKGCSGRMVGHSEVILGPNFPVVTWTYSGVLGHVPVGAEFLLFFSVLAIPK